jgi:hypothetical protein
MKPRLSPAPLTNEDFEIWVGMMAWWHKRFQGPGYYMAESYRSADRRDADLMLALSTAKRIGGTPGPNARMLVYFSVDSVLASLTRTHTRLTLKHDIRYFG